MAAAAAGGPQLISGVCHAPRRLGQRITAEDLAADDDPSSGALGRKSGGRSSVTLAQLVEAGLLTAGSACCAVSYKGHSWAGDLEEDGAIVFEGQRFTSPTAFAVHCKRKQRPGLQADDGWSSVQFRGQPLAYFRKQYEAGGGRPAGDSKPAVQRPARSGSKRPRKRRGSADSDSEGGGEEGSMADEMQWEAQQGYVQPGPSPYKIGGQLVVDLPPDAQVEGADRWVQCERCEVWRLVPSEHWQAVQDDPREEWFCEYATWSVQSEPPHKPACSAGGGGGGAPKSGKKRGAR